MTSKAKDKLVSSRIWIELEKDDNMKLHAENATKLLQLIKIDTHKIQVRGDNYALVNMADGTYLELVDNGHWFNLSGILEMNEGNS